MASHMGRGSFIRGGSAALVEVISEVHVYIRVVVEEAVTC